MAQPSSPMAISNGLTTLGWALAALPAALLVSFAFGALGMAVATYVRSWQDFDYMSVLQFALFLFSGTFAPVDSYPIGFEILIWLTPLYHGVELIRGLTTGVVGLVSLGHAGYLVVLAAVGLWTAGRRMRDLLCK
jgi:ABC-type polysaccharide/polyol phosphate export permease